MATPQSNPSRNGVQAIRWKLSEALAKKRTSEFAYDVASEAFEDADRLVIYLQGEIKDAEHHREKAQDELDTILAEIEAGNQELDDARDGKAKEVHDWDAYIQDKEQEKKVAYRDLKQKEKDRDKAKKAAKKAANTYTNIRDEAAPIVVAATPARSLATEFPPHLRIRVGSGEVDPIAKRILREMSYSDEGKNLQQQMLEFQALITNLGLSTEVGRCTSRINLQATSLAIQWLWRVGHFKLHTNLMEHYEYDDDRREAYDDTTGIVETLKLALFETTA